MYDRTGAPRTVYNRDHDDNKLGPTKTAIVFVVVVGCFAVLWPKVFYPMLVGSANEHIKPSPIDRQSGCCDVISELDVKTIKVMSEICGNIVKQDKDASLTNREALMQCRSTVLETCGIDISAVLQQQIRLGQSVKQIIDEVRSLNGSLCLKYNFGVAPWKLGVPHRIVNNPSVDTIRQERPPHLRSEMVHPAFRERGRAIPQPQSSSLPPKPTPRMVSGKPGPIPGLRPTIGGAGHVVPTKQQSVGGTMGLIMPIYTIAIVIFFSYTVLKLFTKKKPETMAAHLYPPVEPDPHFRREVFESRRQEPVYKREGISSKLVVNAMTALLDEVDEELEARRKASLIAQEENTARSNLSNGKAVIPEEEQPSVKVLGLEVTASCEGDKKWNRPDSPLLPNSGAPLTEPLPPPQEIFLEGALPAQSHLLVSESTTEPEPETGDNEAVVLASKMTLSVISLDSSENGTDESSSDKKSEQMVIIGEDDLKSSSKGSNSSHGSEDFEKIESDILEEQIDDIIEEAKHIMENQTPVKVNEFVEGEQLQLGKKADDKEDNKVNVEEIFEVEEIIEIEQKPVVVEVPIVETSKKTSEQLDERDKVADKTKSSASSGTVEDIEELLSRDDEVEGDLNEQLEYEASDNGSEDLVDEVRHTGRISEERDDINDLLEKYGGNETDESVDDEEDEVVEVQEEVEYVDEEEEVEEVEVEDN